MGFLDRHAAENDLLLALGEALGHGHGREVESLEEVARRLAPTFAALPQNHLGRIQLSGLGHLLDSYFAKERGWRIIGLEPHRNVSGSDLGSLLPVLNQKVPSYIKSVSEGQQKTPGFVLNDAVVLVALLEHLILNEDMEMLNMAYKVNDFSMEDNLLESDLYKVFDAHLVMWVYDETRDYKKNPHLVLKDLAKLVKWTVWHTQLEIVRDVHLNAEFSKAQRTNPFQNRRFSFDEAAQILRTLNRRYAEEHQQSCYSLEEGLIEMDPEATGRVPLGKFYEKKTVGSSVLVESPEYLKNLGVLDDTASGRGLQVIIPNFVTALTNCDAHSKYYAMCCVSQCQRLFNSLEVTIQGPTASKSQILRLVTEQRLSVMDEPGNLSAPLLHALDRVAALRDGEVALHGRMFAQWMHYAFPHHCPYPYVSGVLNPLTNQEWTQQRNASDEAPDDVKKKHIEAVVGDVINPMSMWTVEEELRLGAPQPRGNLRSVPAIFMKVVQIVAGFAALLGLWQSTAATARCWLDGSKTPSMKKEYLV